MKILAILAICLGGYISLANWMMFFQNLKAKDKNFHSAIPLLGALFLGLGMAYFKSTRPFAILSVIIDYGTLVTITATPHLIGEFWKTSRFNLIKTYVGSSQYANYKLNLFKKGIFVIDVKFSSPQICNKHGAKIVEFGLQGDWKEVDGVLEFIDHYGRIFKLISNGSNYLLKDINYPENKEYKYDCLDGIEFSLSRDKHSPAT
jgi:hypothetical protein